MAIVDVVVENKKITLVLPPTEVGSPLEKSLGFGFCATSDLAQQDLTKGGSEELRLFVWRHFLNHIRHGFEYFANVQARKSGAPVEPLAYRSNGVEYAKAQDIPGPTGYSTELGEFQLGQPMFRVTDPCNARTDSSTPLLVPSATGTWRTHVDVADMHNGYAISRLVVAHESVDLASMISPEVFSGRLIGHVSVDSGQCSIFDDAHYPEDPRADDDRLYAVYCAATDCSSDTVHRSDVLRVEPASVLADGTAVVTKTFHGDGYFEVRAVENAAGLAIAIEINFRPDYAEDDEDFDECEPPTA